MAALFVDIDGTCVKFHTSEWLPGVKEKLTTMAGFGHQIIFFTMRGPGRDVGTEWSYDKTLTLLMELEFQYRVIWSVDSPRVMVDDSPAWTINAKTDDPTWWLSQLEDGGES